MIYMGSCSHGGALRGAHSVQLARHDTPAGGILRSVGGSAAGQSREERGRRRLSDRIMGIINHSPFLDAKHGSHFTCSDQTLESAVILCLEADAPSGNGRIDAELFRKFNDSGE